MDPMVAADGVTYERAAIAARRPGELLVSNYALRSQAARFRDERAQRATASEDAGASLVTEPAQSEAEDAGRRLRRAVLRRQQSLTECRREMDVPGERAGEFDNAGADIVA